MRGTLPPPKRARVECIEKQDAFQRQTAWEVVPTTDLTKRVPRPPGLRQSAEAVKEGARPPGLRQSAEAAKEGAHSLLVVVPKARQPAASVNSSGALQAGETESIISSYCTDDFHSYDGGARVAWHGSYNRTSNVNTPHQVSQVSHQNHRSSQYAAAAWTQASDSSSDFANDDANRTSPSCLQAEVNFSEDNLLNLCATLQAHLAEQKNHVVTQLLRRLFDWLWSGCAWRVKASLLDLEFHPTLVAVLTSSDITWRAAAFWACHVVGRIAYEHSASAASLANAGAVEAICDLVERWQRDAEMHLAAASSLEHLLESGGLCHAQNYSEAVGRVLSAIEDHIDPVRP